MLHIKFQGHQSIGSGEEDTSTGNKITCVGTQMCMKSLCSCKLYVLKNIANNIGDNAVTSSIRHAQEFLKLVGKKDSRYIDG